MVPSKKIWAGMVSIPALVLVAPASGFAAVYLTLEEAQKLCFAEATEFVFSDVRLNAAQKKAIERDSGITVAEPVQKVWEARRGNERLGWFIFDEALGKHALISWALALNADGSVRQIEILNYRETYGRDIRKTKWRQQFYGKQHGASLKLNKDIKNISGSTISCQNITDGVKRLLSFYELVLKK